VLQLDPDNLAARRNRGVAAQYLGRFDDALSDYDALLALSPTDIEAQVNRGPSCAVWDVPTRPLRRFSPRSG